MTHPERAAQHAAEAERLLEDSGKHKMQSARGQIAAAQAAVHANLAVYYALADQAQGS